MADPRVGTVVDGRYRIDERLAAGGTGVVYIATQLGLNRAVAIKFLHKSSARSRTHTGRFEREARVMSQMGHPNVAQIIDFGSDEEGSNYLVMELCKGVSLRAILAEGPMDLHRAVHIARQILAGLAHAHEANIVHRDLKPGNVLVVDSLGDGHVKILDFGVAKIMSAEGPTELSVAAGRPLGTPHYMSPEQATSQAVDARTDMYSLGVMLYEMTTGQRPFDAGVGFALLRQHVEDAAKPPHELRDMSPELERVIVRAMEKDPDDRFQTAAEMMEALSQVPEATGAASSGRRRALIAGLSVVALAGAAGAGWYGYRAGWFERSPSSESAGAQGATLDAAVTVRDAGARDARRARVSLPPWRPPAASVSVPTRKPFPSIDNKTLKGRLAGKPFRPRFAVLLSVGDRLLLRLTEEVPKTRFCSDLRWAGPGGTRLSLALPELPKENEPLRSPRKSSVLVTGDETRNVRRVRWRLSFNKLDAEAQIAVGTLRIQGRKVRLRGTFIAAYCPGPAVAGAVAPKVNGMAWAPSRAPDPDRLPAQAVAGAFAHREIVPMHVNVSNATAPLETTLTFFAKTPADPCAQLGPEEVGVKLTLPIGARKGLAMSSQLPANPTGTEASAVFQLHNECSPTITSCPPMVQSRARALSIKVDAVFTGELRGRIYLAGAGPRPSLLVGAFRARDCRKRKRAGSGVDAGVPDGGVVGADGGSVDAGGVDAAGADATTVTAGSADAGGARDGGSPR